MEPQESGRTEEGHVEHPARRPDPGSCRTRAHAARAELAAEQRNPICGMLINFAGPLNELDIKCRTKGTN